MAEMMAMAVEEMVLSQSPQIQSSYGNFTLTMDKETAGNKYCGITPKVMATIEGEQVLIKGGYPKECLAEFFAYKLGTALGYKVNKVSLIDCGEFFRLRTVCSVHWWQGDLAEAGRVSDERRMNGAQLIKFFDNIIHNSDRHNGNYGYLDNGGGDLFLIDHGLASPWIQLTSNDKHNFENLVKNNFFEVRPFVDKFLSLKDNDFINMFVMPENFKYKFEYEDEYDIIPSIIKRMKTIQKLIVEKRKLKIQ